MRVITQTDAFLRKPQYHSMLIGLPFCNSTRIYLGR